MSAVVIVWVAVARRSVNEARFHSVFIIKARVHYLHEYTTPIFVHKYCSADEYIQSQPSQLICLHTNSLAEYNQLLLFNGYALKCSFFTTESDILNRSRATDQSAADAAD